MCHHTSSYVGCFCSLIVACQCSMRHIILCWEQRANLLAATYHVGKWSITSRSGVMHKKIAVCKPCSYHDDIIKMVTFSALLAVRAGNSPVTSEFPTQRPVTRSFDVFFDLCLNKRLSKQLWCWWFETPSCPLWCHCNALILCIPMPHFCIHLNHHCFRWCPVPYLVPNHY